MKVQLRTTSLLQVYIKVCLKKVIENQLTEYLITKIDDNLSVGFVTICLWAVIIEPVFFFAFVSRGYGMKPDCRANARRFAHIE